ncbi:hypothetical protein [Bacillus cereus]|nr:hypothetical protein [Bacillus cereus]
MKLEQMHTSLKNIEKQNQKREILSIVSKKKQDWKSPSKVKQEKDHRFLQVVLNFVTLVLFLSKFA